MELRPPARSRLDGCRGGPRWRPFTAAGIDEQVPSALCARAPAPRRSRRDIAGAVRLFRAAGLRLSICRGRRRARPHRRKPSERSIHQKRVAPHHRADAVRTPRACPGPTPCRPNAASSRATDGIMKMQNAWRYRRIPPCRSRKFGAGGRDRPRTVLRPGTAIVGLGRAGGRRFRGWSCNRTRGSDGSPSEAAKESC